jgi:hypothetical protein
MIRQIIVVLLTCFMFAPSVLAGTFRDDFEDGDFAGWMETFAEKRGMSVWKVENGELIGNRPSGWGASLTIGDPATSQDYAIECNVKIIERIPNEWGSRYHYAGVTGRLRHQNGLEDAGVGFVFNLTTPSAVWKYSAVLQNDNWAFGLNVEEPFDVKLNTWYHLESVMEENTFKLHVDGKLTSSFNSAQIPIGRVGITIGGCIAAFDNIIVIGPDVPDAGPSGFAVTAKGKLAITWAEIKSS